MLSICDFKCDYLFDVREVAPEGLDWWCEKRNSYFNHINAHCRDCSVYRAMLEKLVACLEGDDVD